MELSRRSTPFKFFNETDIPLVLHIPHPLPYTDGTRLILKYKVLPTEFNTFCWNGVYGISEISFNPNGKINYAQIKEPLAQFNAELEIVMECYPDYEITFLNGDVTISPVMIKSAVSWEGEWE